MSYLNKPPAKTEYRVVDHPGTAKELEDLLNTMGGEEFVVDGCTMSSIYGVMMQTPTFIVFCRVEPDSQDEHLAPMTISAH